MHFVCVMGNSDIPDTAFCFPFFECFQLQTLKEWKAEGSILYIGITNYTDEMHKELESIITAETIDFVQFNYSIFSRNAEKNLLKVATDHGVATIINRPFGTGSAFDKVKNK